MTYFPHNPLKRAASPASAPVRQAFVRDDLWNKPVFKAPSLCNPPIAPEPFATVRATKARR